LFIEWHVDLVVYTIELSDSTGKQPVCTKVDSFCMIVVILIGQASMGLDFQLNW
jgi:hypothetical protein